MRQLAPIVVFAFNRPGHLRKSLVALGENRLAAESTLYIYCDGPPEAASPQVLEQIAATRQTAREQGWCKEVHVVERERNLGLADSIREGVSEIVKRHGSVIVLEDDILTSPGFLTYMNDALDVYRQQDSVMHIAGYMCPVKTRLPTTFFFNAPTCWGWATWDRAWSHLCWDTGFLIGEIRKQPDWNRCFNTDGTTDFFTQLTDNHEGRLKTWAVRWYASMFLRNGLALHPYRSLTQNIGHDGSGEHCRTSDRYFVRKLAEVVPVEAIPLVESQTARTALKKFYKGIYHPGCYQRARGKLRLLLGLPQ